jgi:hypothetical protein
MAVVFGEHECSGKCFCGVPVVGEGAGESVAGLSAAGEGAGESVAGLSAAGEGAGELLGCEVRVGAAKDAARSS